jgi:uncharacterized membrane protein YebE (DUF533 family)
MNIDHLVSDVLRGVLGGRRKKSQRATRFLTGNLTGVTRGVMRNPQTLLGIAGVAWGIFETLQNQNRVPSPAGGPTGAAPVPAPAAAPLPPPLPLDDERLRIVRLAVSAANADGAMNEKERAAVTQQVTAAGAAELLERELASPRPLQEIVAGLTDQTDKATLYVLAFTVLRADEQISGAERIYLAQLANLLGLEPALVQALEEDTGQRIDALGDQGQLGG